ncbi:hypothetical protein BASA83_009017 [Batrachochytrium salamandrivorans]|nr:hypothetical protein BASA83_009017 [Batrachochytrium salamandrivorans]
MIVLLVVLSSYQPHLHKRRSYYLTSRTLSLYGPTMTPRKPTNKSAADPFPTIKNLRKDIKTITDKELHLELTDAFAMTRDRHTRWSNMAPYGCFYATTEVEFAFIEGMSILLASPL